MWGKLYLFFIAHKSPRYTPTRVGKTLCRDVCFSEHSVHPHACGENLTNRKTSLWLLGTPPRVWGKPVSPVNLYISLRYTPTRVGKTKTDMPDSELFSVHPHACGENVMAPLFFLALLGTPPRVWGKHVMNKIKAMMARYTPTRVGKTSHEKPISRCG